MHRMRPTLLVGPAACVPARQAPGRRPGVVRDDATAPAMRTDQLPVRLTFPGTARQASGRFLVMASDRWRNVDFRTSAVALICINRRLRSAEKHRQVRPA